MADILRVTGGAVSVLPSTTFADPTTAIFDSEDRNDGSVYTYTQSSHTVTLPSSGLADGYLLTASVHFRDTSNGRVSIAGRFQQTGGTGSFVNGQSGGYNRNNANDECYHNIWAFVDGPSASATFQYQWERESDTPTGGTIKSTLEVIPLFYSNHGIYSGSSTTLMGGTTPNVVPIATTVNESSTAAIERVSNVVTVKGDNKRYFILSSQWYQNRGEPSTTRTQRIYGHDYDGSQDLAAQSYSYFRQGSSDGTGGIIHDLIETVTADRTIEMTCYRGDGIASGDGGADVDGQAPSQAVTALVVLELNTTAEVFRKHDATGGQGLDSATPLDLNAARTDDFTDSASWLLVGTVGVENNSGAIFDALTGSNIWAASTSVGSGTRGTYQGNITVDGVEDADIFHGDYIRGNQGSEDTFGWASNPIGHVSLADNADLGVSVTQVGQTHPTDTQAGTVGFWGLNLDTLAAGADTDISATTDALTLAEVNSTVKADHSLTATTDALTLAEINASVSLGVGINATTDALTLAEVPASVNAETSLTGTTDALTLAEVAATVTVAVNITASTDALTLAGINASVVGTEKCAWDADVWDTAVWDDTVWGFCVPAGGTNISATTDALTLAEVNATVKIDHSPTATTDALTLAEVNAGVNAALSFTATTDALTLAEVSASVNTETSFTATVEALTLAEIQAGIGRNWDAITATLSLAEIPATITFDTIVGAGVDALTLAEVNASVNAALNFTATTDALTLAEINANVNAGLNIAATTDGLTLAEVPATIVFDTIVSAGTDALTLAEIPATVVIGANVSATTDALTLSEVNASVNAETNLTATTDALTITEVPATVSLNVNISATTDALTLSEQPASVNAETSISATTDALTLAVVNTAVSADANTEVSAGTVSLTLVPVSATITAPSTSLGGVKQKQKDYNEAFLRALSEQREELEDAVTQEREEKPKLKLIRRLPVTLAVRQIANIDDRLERQIAIEFELQKRIEFKRREDEALTLLLLTA